MNLMDADVLAPFVPRAVRPISYIVNLTMLLFRSEQVCFKILVKSDIYSPHKSQTRVSIFKSFSLFSLLGKITHLRDEKNQDNLHTNIRVLSTLTGSRLFERTGHITDLFTAISPFLILTATSLTMVPSFNGSSKDKVKFSL